MLILDLANHRSLCKGVLCRPCARLLSQQVTAQDAFDTWVKKPGAADVVFGTESICSVGQNFNVRLKRLVLLPDFNEAIEPLMNFFDNLVCQFVGIPS